MVSTGEAWRLRERVRAKRRQVVRRPEETKRVRRIVGKQRVKGNEYREVVSQEFTLHFFLPYPQSICGGRRQFFLFIPFFY